MKITFISDTHNKHNQVTSSLPGGDLLVHTGDISSMGYQHEIQQFLKWFNKLDNYTHKIFIAGNHDWGFQNNVEKVKDLLTDYQNVDYLEDDWIIVGDNDPHDVNVKTAKIYGSPWQPEFYNWAFNLPRNGEELKAKWDMIPMDTDILLTHGPAWGHLDTIVGQTENLGCELLSQRIEAIRPKIHVCGHIHTGYGYKFDGQTHFFNASVLNERYDFTQKPMTVDWNPDTNELTFVD